MNPNTAPPIQYIIGNDGTKYITEGNHRFFAAAKRNDQFVLAEEAHYDSETKKNLLKIFEKN